ncbi:MAG: NRDE family protein [Syntrophomonadaceae bacterium]|nr:NRDE family protein [Syntrophomonadaceae bacterium]
MCTILFAYDYHPRYQLVVAANRDEFYQRPTSPVAFWPDNRDILAGRDLKEGGTWMGITTSGRFAALTNYRDPASFKPEARSRGHLVKDYLSSDLAPETYAADLVDGGSSYNGFNLLMGTNESMYYYSNREKIIRNIPAGVHGLSNALLNTPWPKVTRGIKTLATLLQHDDIKVEQLFTMMTDREQPHDQELPRTGVSLEMERMLAPTFVMSPKYGTCLTTVILVERNHNVQLWERSFKDGQPDNWEEVYYQFAMNGY